MISTTGSPSVSLAMTSICDAFSSGEAAMASTRSDSSMTKSSALSCKSGSSRSCRRCAVYVLFFTTIMVCGS